MTKPPNIPPNFQQTQKKRRLSFSQHWEAVKKWWCKNEAVKEWLVPRKAASARMGSAISPSQFVLCVLGIHPSPPSAGPGGGSSPLTDPRLPWYQRVSSSWNIFKLARMLETLGMCQRFCESGKDGKCLRPVWEIQQQGILMRGSTALLQEDILNTWNLADFDLFMLKLFHCLDTGFSALRNTVDRSCLSHKKCM